MQNARLGGGHPAVDNATGVQAPLRIARSHRATRSIQRFARRILAGTRRTLVGTMHAAALGMDSVGYVEIGLWVLNIIIYASCIWLWLRPESD